MNVAGPVGGEMVGPAEPDDVHRWDVRRRVVAIDRNAVAETDWARHPGHERKIVQGLPNIALSLPHGSGNDGPHD